MGMRFSVLLYIRREYSSELAVRFQVEHKVGKHIRWACDFQLFLLSCTSLHSFLLCCILSLFSYLIPLTFSFLSPFSLSLSLSLPPSLSLISYDIKLTSKIKHAIFCLYYAFHFLLFSLFIYFLFFHSFSFSQLLHYSSSILFFISYPLFHSYSSLISLLLLLKIKETPTFSHRARNSLYFASLSSCSSTFIKSP